MYLNSSQPDIEEKISKSSFNLHLQFTMPKERSRSKRGTRKSDYHLENDEVLQNESEGQSAGTHAATDRRESLIEDQHVTTPRVLHGQKTLTGDCINYI